MEEQAGEHEQPADNEGTRWNFAELEEIAPRLHALQRIGGGHQYEAYLCWEDRLFSLVVVKLVRPHLVGDEHVLHSFAREAEILRRLSHPVIVRSFGAALDGPRPRIVMEHLEGNTLASLIHKEPVLPPEQILPLTFQVCSAIHYMAEEQFVHLDVKPRNIIMGAPPRLIDLSVARTFEQAGEITGPIGTDAYMAPEQCDPAIGPIGPASDVWGLGASLYHAVTGKIPFPRPESFDETNLESRFPQISKPPQELPRTVPAPIRDLILECMRADASQRPAAGEVAASLEPLIDALPKRPLLGRLRPKF